MLPEFYVSFAYQQRANDKMFLALEPPGSFFYTFECFALDDRT